MIGGKFILELKSLSKVEIILRWKFKDNSPPFFSFFFWVIFPTWEFVRVFLNESTRTFVQVIRNLKRYRSFLSNFVLNFELFLLRSCLITLPLCRNMIHAACNSLSLHYALNAIKTLNDVQLEPLAVLRVLKAFRASPRVSFST